MKFDTVVL